MNQIRKKDAKQKEDFQPHLREKTEEKDGKQNFGSVQYVSTFFNELFLLSNMREYEDVWNGNRDLNSPGENLTNHIIQISIFISLHTVQ